MFVVAASETHWEALARRSAAAGHAGTDMGDDAAVPSPTLNCAGDRRSVVHAVEIIQKVIERFAPPAWSLATTTTTIAGPARRRGLRAVVRIVTAEAFCRRCLGRHAWRHRRTVQVQLFQQIVDVDVGHRGTSVAEIS